MASRSGEGPSLDVDREAARAVYARALTIARSALEVPQTWIDRTRALGQRRV